MTFWLHFTGTGSIGLWPFQTGEGAEAFCGRSPTGGTIEVVEAPTRTAALDRLAP